ncbi:ABC transporter ATP-binding protein [Paroceanicella profunda]|uniref:ABC transporter ATP-binding protein n=1 Tax=Paroceanicella profunda TaxID=2579971 RepID=A0A5B8FGS3_9RHOB|nr:ABC transporter ATP-binding protein [Paroceanicella profunda]QDL91218.1 ABC transporter ATP-binding protein [Paroceanicella profunda]
MSGTALQVDALTRHYGGVRAVNGASFEIPEGSITGLIGPNGAGKTTTFNMIAGAETPTSGRIRFRGQDITGRPTHELFHLGIVRTFQLPQEFARLTALENLMAAAPGQPGESILLNWLAPGRVRAREAEVLERAEESLAFLGLSQVRDIPAGNLSGGQRKLLELGRTMMTDAQLVLLDEPGAGVNPTLMLRIADMIRRLNAERGYTFCIIEHDMDLIAALCDPVIVLAEGRVLTRGAMADIREDPRVIEAYFGGGAA